MGATNILLGGERPEDGEFDRVLIDAPCSNTGVMRRRVELRWRIRSEEIHRLAATQMELLRGGAKRVRTGGVLVYSTCSLEREENQKVVGQFLAENTSFSLDKERELTPMKEGVDGAYCARLIRRG
jgi:16S rRNA (cytosine967-C5)-methyltransferase